MKAVILAAGCGTRIQEVSHGAPKCLLQFGTWTILDYQIESLWEAGVSRVGIVIGHNGHLITSHIHQTYRHCDGLFDFIWNPSFQTTNNIYSLWLARDWVGSEDFLCMNADILLHPGILPPALTLRKPVSMIVDPEWRDETMKVIIRDGNVVRMDKAIPRSKFSATYIGITAFSSLVTPALFDEIKTMLDAGQVNQFFNAAVQNLVNRGLHVGFSTTGGLPWAEIDDPMDLRYARTYVQPLLPRRSSLPLGGLAYSVA